MNGAFRRSRCNFFRIILWPIPLISFQALAASAELFPTACATGRQLEQMQSRYCLVT